jgi:hypothetical protein
MPEPFLALITPLTGAPGVPTHPIVTPPPYPDQGLPPGFPGAPSHPIVIPPGAIGPGVPSHPIVLPPPAPGHPIVIPPGSLAPGTPSHPIVLPPPYPGHPIVIPPGSVGPGVPTHPIYLPPYPDQGLPPIAGYPPYPDQGLPPGSPGAPDQGLPVPPDVELPELPPELAAQIVVLVHKPGQEWTMSTYPVGPSQNPVPVPTPHG